MNNDALRAALVAATAIAVATTSCGDAERLTAAEIGDEPAFSVAGASIIFVSSQEQQGAPGELVPDAPTVQLVGPDGRPVAGRRIRFSVLSGGGSVSEEATRTDSFGRASAQWRLGPQVGRQTLRARHGDLTVVFAAWANSAAPVVADVEVTPGSIHLDALGETGQLAAFAFDSVGAQIPASITWRTTSTAVATVDSAGLVRATGNGTAGIIAVSADGPADTALVTVAQKVAAVAVSPSSASIGVGGTARFTATARDERGHQVSNATFQWSSTQPNVASVDGAGVTTGVTAGTTSIRASADGVAGSATLTVTSSPGGGGLYPNLPSGMTVLDSFDGSVEADGGSAFGMDFMDGWETDGSAPADQIAVVRDDTNPTGSGQALRFRWSDHLNPRSGSATGYFNGGPYREVYFMFRVYWESTGGGWVGLGPKLLYFGLDQGGRPDATDLYIDVGEGDSSRIRLVNQNGGDPNVVIRSNEAPPTGTGSTPRVLDKWVAIEVLLVDESAPGARDGAAYMWVDGTLIGYAENIHHGEGSGRGWSGMRWYADNSSDGWEDSYYRIGEIFIAGRK